MDESDDIVVPDSDLGKAVAGSVSGCAIGIVHTQARGGMNSADRSILSQLFRPSAMVN